MKNAASRNLLYLVTSRDWQSKEILFYKYSLSCETDSKKKTRKKKRLSENRSLFVVPFHAAVVCLNLSNTFPLSLLETALQGMGQIVSVATLARLDSRSVKWVSALENEATADC